MPFPPITLHPRISSPGKELFRKKKPNIVPPQSVLNGAKTSKEEKDCECEKEKLSTSWPSANLKQLGLKPQPQASKLPTPHRAALDVGAEGKSSWLALPPPPPPVSSSCDSVARSSSGESGAHKGSKHSSRSSLAKEEGDEEIRFTLSLTPEAILVIQKRNLEKQMMAKQQKCCASGDFRHRRVFPSKRAQGGSKSGIPAASKLENPEDIRTIVKISLLNDQYKYDDVEYEEEDGDVDETVMRKCKEWLKGVESAAAFSKVDKLASVQHLKSC
ncbi:proline-rich protein 18 [Scleropages formosus]|uniref:Proline rich 18 n=1 Tax=Scleropages formosus TaxID=113540 RepID=A0A8C9W4Q7_SCLFO|nr:proline-rich protein 18 [Scleropages formosus]